MSEAEKERAAIVAWLREQERSWFDDGAAHYGIAAEAIERGDHLRDNLT